jgi:hypothetical protein
MSTGSFFALSPDHFSLSPTLYAFCRQLAAFDIDEKPFNNEVPEEATLARAGNSANLWNCNRTLPSAFPHGGWQLSSRQNVSSPFIRQAKLLTQAYSFITAISSADGDGILVDRQVREWLVKVNLFAVYRK